MRRSVIALGAFISAASIFYAAAPARAEIDYPVCRLGGGEGGYAMRCDFANLDQCRATTAGIGGTCLPNPSYNSSNANASYQGRVRRVH